MDVYRETALTAIVTILLIIVLLWMYDLIYELRQLNKYPRPTVDTRQSELKLVPWVPGQYPEFFNVRQYPYQYRCNSPIRSVAPVQLQELQYTSSLANEFSQALQQTTTEARRKSKATPRKSPNNEAYTPFLVACYNCDIVKIATFIKAGADILQKTRNGETGLLLATYQMAKERRPWNPLCLHILLSNGCSVNEPTIDGNTALHIAVKQNHLAVTKWLLNHGASVYIANTKGWSPMDIAVAQQRQDIVDVLQEAEDMTDISDVDEEKGTREAKDIKGSSEYHSAL